jgi:outer membrane immunogenic protein
MRFIAIVVACVAALCASARHGVLAADLALTPPPSQEPFVPSWTGFYVGGSVGSGWGQNDTTIVAPTVLLFAMGSVPLASQGERGFLGGLQGGYNRQWGSIVVGVEASGDWMNLTGTAPCTNFPFNAACTSTTKEIVDVGGRVGFVAGNALLYLKGGEAWAHSNFGISTSAFGAAPFSVTTNNKYSGAFLGAGVEFFAELVGKNRV